MKILKLFGKLDQGGAEVRTLELIKEIKEKKSNHFDFHILVLSGESGSLDQEYKKCGVQIHYIKLKSLKFIFKFYSLLKKEKFDVLYSNVFLFSGVMMFFGKIFNIPTRISHIRTLYDEKEKDSMIRKIRNFILKKFIVKFSDQVIGVNKVVLTRNFGNIEKFREKFIVLNNGIKPVDLEIKLNTNKCRNINIIHIGRQVPAKNHVKLLNVFAAFNKIYPDSKLHLVGKTSKDIEYQLNKIIDDNQIKSNVISWGVSSDINSLFLNKNLLILPSVREGLPGVVLESLANGVPVLASDIDPNKELSNFFEDIHLMSLEDSHLKWANKMDCIIKESDKVNNPQIIKEFVESPFTFEHHVENYLEILEKNFKSKK